MLGLVLALTLFACSATPPDLVVEIAGVRFNAEFADTVEKRAQGLSGRHSLANDAAMWFDLGRQRHASFVMRSMQFPLDIVWVDESLHVVHVTPNAPVPSEGARGGSQVRYSSGAPARYVLEINAGLAQAHGIRPGMEVRVAPP